ncbi:hypothetical protein ANTPLA_LOCUS4213 [Anthophora plagiata]
MDVFKIDQSLSAGLGSAPAPDTLTPEVSFDAGSEFNLSFFDGPEENSTQGFSDPGSVGSASASPPPGTPASIPVNPSNAALPIVQVPPGIVIKQVVRVKTTAILYASLVDDLDVIGAGWMYECLENDL